jgi:hypothetical protein
MNTKHGTDKYAAQRALFDLDMQRASPDWAGDTAIYPVMIVPPAADDMAALPALLRRQAE